MKCDVHRAEEATVYWQAVIAGPGGTTSLDGYLCDKSEARSRLRDAAKHGQKAGLEIIETTIKALRK